MSLIGFGLIVYLAIHVIYSTYSAKRKVKMEFLVLSRLEIGDFSTDKKHIIISIMDPNDSEGPAKIPENKNNIGILTLAFHDLDGKAFPQPPTEYILFDSKMAKQIIDFVNNFILWDLELIVCQCEAGISRSAGVAAALAKCINGNDKYFFEHYIPNSLVYSLILKENYEGGENAI